MKLKRIMAMVLCVAMVLSTMSFNVFAEGALSVTPDDFQSVLMDAPEGSIIQLTESETAYEFYRWDVDFKDITIIGVDGATVNQFQVNGTVENLVFQNVAFTAGISFSDTQVNGLTFDGCTFTTEKVAITAGNSASNPNATRNDVTITGCSFTGSVDNHSLDLGKLTGETKIVGNTFENVRNAFQMSVDSGTVLIDDNTISNTGDRAMRLATIGEDVTMTISNNVMTNACDSNNEVFKVTSVAGGSTINFVNNTYNDMEWNPDTITGPASDVVYADVIETPAETIVATVEGVGYTDIQEAIVAAAPSGTVTLVDDVVVDEWVMFSEKLSIGSGKIITLESINGLTIDGKGKTLTIKSIESAGNGNRLFYDAQKLNIKDLTIECVDAATSQGGIGLTSGTLENVNFVGGGNAILPGDGEITITGCDFATNGTAIYYEEERDNLVVTGCEFNQPEGVNVILIRGNTTFTNNVVNSGRTVNVVSGSPVVTGNNFNNVRFKVYNASTASIEENKIIVLEFNDESEVKSSFSDNTLSEDAKSALKDAGISVTITAVAAINGIGYPDFQSAYEAAEAGDTITMVSDIIITKSIDIKKNITLDLNGKTIEGIDKATVSFGLINVHAGYEFTIKDSVGTGKITLTAANNREWNAYSSVVSNQRGKLTVNGGTIEHLGGTDMAYGIDNLTNGKGTYAETIINGGTIKSPYRAVRQFLNGIEADNILTINGGIIEGTNKAIWMQDPSKNANTGSLTITDGAKINGDVYLFVAEGSTAWPVVIDIATSAVNGEILTANVPEGYELVTENGKFSVEESVIPAGTVTLCYTSANAFWGEAGSNAVESFVIKLFEGDKEIASASLNDINNIIDGELYVTWNIPFAPNNDGYWNVEWAEGYPKYDMNPTAVKLFSDGVEVAENVVKFNAPDDLKKIVALAEDAEGNVKAYENLKDAVASATKVSVVRDTTLDEELTLPAGITFNGNGKNITGNLVASGDVTFAGHTKVTNFNAGYNKPVVTIGEGACLELTGTGRAVIGHGATFNITGTIENAKTAANARAIVEPSLILSQGASFTGAGVNFNVKNAYIKTCAQYSSSSKSASGTFNFNIENSIWEEFDKLAFEAQSVNAIVNFNLKDSVINTGSHLVFGVDKGEIVIDNSIINDQVNNGTRVYRQLENRSTMTIKNGSVVYASVATSSNANHPGTLTVDNATFISTGEFGGAGLGQGTLILKNGANFTTDYLSNVNYSKDATSTLTVNKEIRATAVIKKVASVNGVEYTTLAEAIEKAQADATITLLSDVTENVTIKKDITLDGAENNYTGKITVSGDVDVTIQKVKFVGGSIEHSGSSYGNLTVKGCSFADVEGTADDGIYAVTTARIASVTIEDCTVTTKQGLLNAKLSTSEITVKNVNISGGYYVARILYNNKSYFENVTATNMAGYGIQTQNNGAKNITLKNCSFETPNYNSIYVSTKTEAVDTFIFQGENSMTSLRSNEYAKYVLSDVDATLKTGEGYTVTAADEMLNVIYEDGIYKVKKVAKIGEKYYSSLESAFNDAKEGETITLIDDASPALTSQRAITKASVIDLNNNTLTLTEDDLYFGTTTFKNGDIVVDPSVKASTAVFWMFENQTLRFDNVDIIATGVTGTYLIGINGGTGSAVNLLNGSSIIIDNASKAGLTAVICDNGTGNTVTIDGADIDVKNIEGRFYLGGENGTITVNDSEIDLNGVKEGFYVRAGQTLAIKGNSNVNIELNDNNGRFGIALNGNAVYSKDATATVNSTTNAIAAIEAKNAIYNSLKEAFAAAVSGDTITVLADMELTDETITIDDDKALTLDLNGKTITATENKTGNYELFYNFGELTVVGNGSIELTATVDRDWNALSAIFHNRGGVLTIEDGTFTHNGGTDMAYVVDNSGNSFGDATTNIKDGSLSSTYIAIRNRMDTYGANGGGNGIATLNVTGGNIYGYRRGIWGQVSSTGAKGNINISGGSVTSVEQDAVVVGTDATGEINTAISGGTFSSDVSAFLVDGTSISKNADGTYGVVAERAIEVSASKDKVVAGEEFTVTVKFAKGENIFNAAWTLSYETDKFELKDSADQSGTIKGIIWKTFEGEKFAQDEVLKTYTFVAKAVAAETTGNFALSETTASTFAESRDDIYVAAVTNDPVPVTIIMKDYTVFAAFNGELVNLTAENPAAETTYNGAAHKFVVETDLPEDVDYEITYTVNGEEVEEVALTNAGKYEVVYTITTENGYANKTGKVTITVNDPDFVVETSKWTNMGKRLVLVYTKQDNLYFTYNGNLMIDVTEREYKYENTEEYPHVFAFVTDALAKDEVDSYRANIKYLADGTGLIKLALAEPEKLADINFSRHLNVQDISVEYGIINLHSEIYGDVKYQKHLLKGDTNGDKIVNGKDTAFVVSEVKTALGIN